MIYRSKVAQITALAFIAAAPVSATTFFGSGVAAAIYCCTAPTEVYRISDIASTTVYSETEFPASTFVFTEDGSRWDTGIVDIGESWIRVTSTIAEVTNPGIFNGMIFSFNGAPTLIGATLNSTSTMVPTSISVQGSSIIVNAPAMTVAANSYMLIDIALAPVPEPKSFAMIIAGILALTFWLKRRSDADA